MNMVEKLAHLAAVIAEGHEREEQLIVQLGREQQKVKALEAEKSSLLAKLSAQEDMSR